MGKGKENKVPHQQMMNRATLLLRNEEDSMKT